MIANYIFDNATTVTNRSTFSTSAPDGAYVGDATISSDSLLLSGGVAGAGNWDQSTLTIGRDDGNGGISGHTNDVIGAKSDSNVELANGVLKVSGSSIGTFTNSNGILEITFNSAATTSRVHQALQNLTYSSSIQTPGALNEDNVTLRVIFNDQNSNTQLTGLPSGSVSGPQEQVRTRAAEICDHIWNDQHPDQPLAGCNIQCEWIG